MSEGIKYAPRRVEVEYVSPPKSPDDTLRGFVQWLIPPTIDALGPKLSTDKVSGNPWFVVTGTITNLPSSKEIIQ